MATLTRGKTFVSGETVEPADLHALVDSATIAGIVNADIDASAAIAASKLATTAQQSLVPAGAVMAFAMNSAPSGWLSADGTAVSRTTYAALFAAIGTTHGAGDGSTTFNLPDLRGIFVRGSGTQTINGTAYSGTLAQKQQDQLRSHTHTETAYTFGVLFNAGGSSANIVSATATSPNTGAASPSGSGSTLVGSETQPVNISLLYCIKF